MKGLYRVEDIKELRVCSIGERIMNTLELYYNNLISNIKIIEKVRKCSKKEKKDPIERLRTIPHL